MLFDYLLPDKETHSLFTTCPPEAKIAFFTHVVQCFNVERTVRGFHLVATPESRSFSSVGCESRLPLPLFALPQTA
jgi:hypothetical protein